MRTNETKNEIYEIKIWEEKIKRRNLKYKEKYTYDFLQYETIRYFGDNIYTGKANIDEAEIDQSNFFKNIITFSNKSRLRTIEGKDKKLDTYESVMHFMKVEN